MARAVREKALPPRPVTRTRMRIVRRAGTTLAPLPVAACVCVVCAESVPAGGRGWDEHRRCVFLLAAHRDGNGAGGAAPPGTGAPRDAFSPDEATTEVDARALSPAWRRVGWAVGYYGPWVLLAFVVAATARACATRLEVPPW